MLDRLLRELDQIQRIHNSQADFEKSMALLAALQSGEVCLNQVVLAAGGWTVGPPPPQARPVEVEWPAPRPVEDPPAEPAPEPAPVPEPEPVPAVDPTPEPEPIPEPETGQ